MKLTTPEDYLKAYVHNLNNLNKLKVKYTFKLRHATQRSGSFTKNPFTIKCCLKEKRRELYDKQDRKRYENGLGRKRVNWSCN